MEARGPPTLVYVLTCKSRRLLTITTAAGVNIVTNFLHISTHTRLLLLSVFETMVKIAETFMLLENIIDMMQIWRCDCCY